MKDFAPPARLFSEPPLETLLANREWNPLIRRILEDGDREDLGWLLTTLGEDELLTWFERWGSRRLSSRSRAFWALIWDRPRYVDDEGRASVWPY